MFSRTYGAAAWKVLSEQNRLRSLSTPGTTLPLPGAAEERLAQRSSSRDCKAHTSWPGPCSPPARALTLLPEENRSWRRTCPRSLPRLPALLQPRCPHSVHRSPVLGQEKPGRAEKGEHQNSPCCPQGRGGFGTTLRMCLHPCTVSHETSANKGCKGGGSTASAAPGPVPTAKGSGASTVCNSQKVLTSPWK